LSFSLTLNPARRLQGRSPQPEEFANTALFLASDESSFIAHDLLSPLKAAAVQLCRV
jgi:hypothetical protein